MVREQIGPVAAFKQALVVAAPAQDALRQDPARHHAQDRRRREFAVPATIDDASVIEDLRAALGDDQSDVVSRAAAARPDRTKTTSSQSTKES